MADKSSSETPQSARSAQSGAGAGPGSAGGQPAQGQSRQGATDQRAGRGSGAMQRRSFSPFLAGAGLSPFSLMRRMMEDMDQMLDVYGSGRATGGAQRQGGGGLSAVWTPAIEVLERDGALVVRADLPGMSPEDVRIEVTDDSLILEGERRQEIEVEEEGGVYRSERVYGRFSRVLPLPDGANVEKAQARFENGVLEISIPLAEDASRRRRIEIQGGAQSDGGKASPSQGGGGPNVH